MGTYRQKEVSKAVWHWQEMTGEAGKLSLTKKLVSVLGRCLLLALGGMFFLVFFKRLFPAYLIFSLATLILVSGFLLPALFLALVNLEKLLGIWIGRVLTYLMLVPLFYLFFVPAHLISIMSRKDPLNRKFPTDLKTYWVCRPPVSDIDYYKGEH